MARRSDINWEAIEVEYRLGHKTNKQLAAEFSVQPSTIGRRAEKYGWVQDKRQEVQVRAGNMVIQGIVNERLGKNAAGNANANATPTEADIKVAATVVSETVLSHRRGLKKLTQIKDAMVIHLEATFLERDTLLEISKAARRVRNDDNEAAAKQQSARERLLDRVLEFPAMADALKKLSEVDAQIRKGEREAVGIKEGDSGEEPAGRVLGDTERASRAAALLTIAFERQRAAAAMSAAAAPVDTA